jgi:hypothetical protein
MRAEKQPPTRHERPVSARVAIITAAGVELATSASIEQACRRSRELAAQGAACIVGDDGAVLARVAHGQRVISDGAAREAARRWTDTRATEALTT